MDQARQPSKSPAPPPSATPADEPRVRFPRRGWLTQFVAAHQLRWDLTFGALAVVYLTVGVAADVGSGAYDAIIAALAVIFLGEFFLRLWDCGSRYEYLRGHWIDLVSAIPLIGGLRTLRLLRLLRLGAAIRVLSSAERTASGHGGRQSLWYLGPALIVIWFSAAIAYYLLEKDADPAVHGFGAALSWSFLTATTVGYGTRTPVTTGGQILNGCLILASVGLVGIISSRLVAMWLGEETSESDRQVLARLTSMEDALLAQHTTLVALEAKLSALHPAEHQEADELHKSTRKPPTER